MVYPEKDKCKRNLWDRLSENGLKHAKHPTCLFLIKLYECETEEPGLKTS